MAKLDICFSVYISNLFQTIVFTTQIKIKDSCEHSDAVSVFTVYEMTTILNTN